MPPGTRPYDRSVPDELVVAVAHQALVLESSDLSDMVRNAGISNSASFAAAAVTGEIAAGTVPGEREPREALNDLLSQAPHQPGADIWAYDHRVGT